MTTELKVKVSKDGTRVTVIDTTRKAAVSAQDAAARKALPGAKLSFRGETVRDGKAVKTARVYHVPA